MAKLFVSYSRRDSVAARKLIEAFRSIDQDVWVDWESIPPAVDWLEQIFRGIEESDAFIFLISPDSTASEVCKVEINRAAQNNKRIIPIVLRDVHPSETPESIRKLNWTFIRESDNFEEGLAKVKTAIELDLDWLEEHRRLQVRALEWHRKKDTSLLLHGRDLRNARRMVATATSKDPASTDLQKTYIQHSLRSERNRMIAWIATACAVIALAALFFLATEARDEARVQRDRAVVAQAEESRQRQIAQTAQADETIQRQIAQTAQAEEAVQRKNAVQREIEAEAQRSAARAQIQFNRPGELYTSTLLAIDSMRRDPSNEAEEILRRNISLLPLPVAQFSQAGKINDLVLDPDGDTFATASADGAVCAWKVADGEIDNLFCHSSGSTTVNAVAYNWDGSFLATGDQAGLIQILDSQNGEVLRSFRRIDRPGSQVEFAEVTASGLQEDLTFRDLPVRTIRTRPSQGQQIAITYSDEWIPVFDANTGNISSPIFVANRPNVSGISPNGAWLVAGSEGGRVSVWNLSGSNRFSTSTHSDSVLALAFSPTENKVVTAGGNTISVSNLSLEKELYRILVQSPVRDIAFSPNGLWFVTVSDDHRVRVWETYTGNELLSMSQDGAVTEAVISSNGSWIATTGTDRTARVWDAKTGAEIFQVPLKANGAKLAFLNDDRWLVTTDENGAIAVWDISVMILPNVVISSSGIVSHVQYSPSGEWLAVAAEDKIWLLTPDRESIVEPRALGSPAEDFDSNIAKLVFSPNSELIGILTRDNEVAVFNLETRRRVQVQATERIQSIAFSPDSLLLITSDLNGNVQAWDILNGELRPDDDGLPQGSVLASAAEVLAVGSSDQIVLLGGDTNGDSPAIDFSGGKTLMVLSPDGSLLASSSSTGEVTIFEYRDGQLMQLSSFAKGQAASLAFHPDGSLIAVGTTRNVFLMDVTTGKEVARVPHLSTVNGVSFSADGGYLVTGSSQGIQFWDMKSMPLVPSDELVTIACSYVYEDLTPALWQTFFGDEPQQSLCENLHSP
ncbi:MAG: TIR domain-containing protein [Chloroflexota bacterium]|nr:TIR domain-containing protein [Chloroflexota bacterium]